MRVMVMTLIVEMNEEKEKLNHGKQVGQGNGQQGRWSSRGIFFSSLGYESGEDYWRRWEGGDHVHSIWGS